MLGRPNMGIVQLCGHTEAGVFVPTSDKTASDVRPCSVTLGHILVLANGCVAHVVLESFDAKLNVYIVAGCHFD